MPKPLFKPWLILCFVIAIAPAILLGNAVFSNTVDLIFGDEWGVVWFYNYKFLQGNLTLDDLMQQHNESRLLFPKLVFFGLAALNQFRYNTYNECILMFAVACLVSLNVFLLSRLTLPLRSWQHLLLAAIANLLIFSPMQHENWGWGIQLIVFIPIACVTTALVVTKLKLNFTAIAFVTALLGSISTFSYANGMLFWAVIFPALLAVRVPSFKQVKNTAISRWKIILVWLIFVIFNVIFYFHNYQKPGYHPSFLEALKKPLDSILYLLAFLGSPLGAGSLFASQIMGSILLICLIWIGVQLWHHRHEQWLQMLYPWLCMGAYTLLSAIITTDGRVGFGVGQAMSPRYTTFSAYGWVALVYLIAALWLQRETIALSQTKRSQLLGISAIGLLVIMLVMQIFSWSHGQRRMEVQYRNRLYGKSCLLAQELIVETDCIKAFVFAPFQPNEGDIVIAVSEGLESRNAWQPGLIALQEFNEAVASQASGSTLYGYVDTPTSQDVGGFFKFGGWSVLPEYKYPAHGVMLVALDAQGKPTPFAIAPVKKKRSDVKQVIGTSEYRSQRYGWEMNVPKARIPADATQVIALAIDTHTGNLHRLVGSTQLKRST
ncbi:MAG TPA: hypothetical protein IGS53_00205 [Leptolyngbyaceae cyanobacterium M33_DOE_097]|nr:hypothetical protein [Leptolyngbyaceae cyanobacterium M33_DOE_097]